jgi:hypothetical protein
VTENMKFIIGYSLLSDNAIMKLTTLLIMLFWPFFALSQSDTARNALFVEVWRNDPSQRNTGNIYNGISLNYERRFFLKENVTYNPRVGAGLNIPFDHSYLQLSNSLNWGKGASQFETGIGAMAAFPKTGASPGISINYRIPISP